MEQGSVKEHARLGVVTIMQDYRYLGRGKNLALITELFSTYPYSATSKGTLKLPSVQRRCAIADTSPSSCHQREFDARG